MGRISKRAKQSKTAKAGSSGKYPKSSIANVSCQVGMKAREPQAVDAHVTNISPLQNGWTT